jgi:hypothetical protein
MIALLDELRASMGVRPSVELREVPDLTTPATAGWRRPVLLLPVDWRSWDASERRAVFAHELAHIIRGDYAAGLLARLAVVLNSYHPLVLWMAGRLHLQQELAADALGARFAGGRTSYLVALSRLALRQDGRSPCWPARAFLPVRGTLIRRIAMLRDETGRKAIDRPWSGARRLLTALGLLALTTAVATLRSPARGAEDDPPAVAATKARSPMPRTAETSFEPLYVHDGMDGVVAFRPAAAFRHAGMGRLVPTFRAALAEVMGVDFSGLAKDLKIDTSRPGFLKLDFNDIEWVASGFRFGRGKNDERDDVHSIGISGLTVRTVAPFDWLAFLRQWRLDCSEVREGGRLFYKITGPLKPVLGVNPCVYLPDDRTLVWDEEDLIRVLLRRESPAPPAYLRGADWGRVSRGLLAVAINNQDGALAKRYDLGRPDDAVFLSLFKGVDRWVLGVDDDETIVLHAAAACRDRDASESITRAIDALLKLGRDAVEHPDPEALAAGAHDRIFRMVKALLANIRVERTDRSIDCRTGGFGTLADFASIVEAEAGEERTPKREGKDGSSDSER